MGCVIPSREFLIALRELTARHGTLLIFDEVMTGFRVALGGAQSLWGLRPDLTTLGKIVGGGLPVGAYGGRADIMDHVLPAGKVFQAGTLSGNPLATAAGIATLELLRDEAPYERLERLSARLAEGLDSAAQAAGVPHVINRVGSMLTLFFQPGPVTDWKTASRQRYPALRPLFLGTDRTRRLPAVQPVRSVVRLGCPHGSRHRCHGLGGRMTCSAGLLDAQRRERSRSRRAAIPLLFGGRAAQIERHELKRIVALAGGEKPPTELTDANCLWVSRIPAARPEHRPAIDPPGVPVSGL